NKSNFINIDKDRINNIIVQIKKLLENNKKDLNNKLYKEISTISQNIDTLTNYPIELFFKPYEKLVAVLASKLEKYINPLVLEIEQDIYIPSNYIPFINSLVHIFRNSVDHGIESLDDRYEAEKDEYGTIECKIKKIDNNIEITISDDGAGVDIEKIRSLAIEKNIHTKSELENFTEKDIVMIIFKDAFSTKDTISTISGRGVGLASIVTELENIDGSMDVENSFGKGIKVTFTLNYNSEETFEEEDEVLFVF
ncbi:MAG: ATP-binding protein, partial [Campylobacterota bacterium]|nr:ATP-binding protein [Campylobacterota bacterium]